MVDFVDFISAILSNLSIFLMAEPMKYFVGLAILAFIVAIFNSVCKTAVKGL